MTQHGPGTTLRLILGDQLNPKHAWLNETRADVVYVLMEVRQETDYVLHHAQKVLAIFAAMRDFARQLREAGHRVHYLKIDDSSNRQAITANLDALIVLYEADAFEYQEPDEFRLDAQLSRYVSSLTIRSRKVDSGHFYTKREETAQWFAGHRTWVMDRFYRTMRVRHRVLIDDKGKPAGGQWNFDRDNRKPWHGSPSAPADIRSAHDHSALWQSIIDAGVKSFGAPDASRFSWPLNRDEALQQLGVFIEHVLPHFGSFQDAMHSREPRLFHSLLSFALNSKMLNPHEVVLRAESAWRAGSAPLAAVEGFVRQILGWREYVRGVYWTHMPHYVDHNVFDHHRPLPAWFWNGQTHLNCLAHAIGQSLDHAYAHHIQRLMVIGNFALLAGLDPGAVHRWYLGVYIDAFEWVEAPNTLGMSQFADGGLMATKPYVSSAAYINRMSNYCKTCKYDKQSRTGERACPFNALYWDFFARNAKRLSANPRLALVYRQLEGMDNASLDAIRERARTVLDRLELL